MEGKSLVRKKGGDWVEKIREVHGMHTTPPIVVGNSFAVGRQMDTTVEGFGRVKIDEIMVYEVKDGRIVFGAILLLEIFLYPPTGADLADRREVWGTITNGNRFVGSELALPVLVKIINKR